MKAQKKTKPWFENKSEKHKRKYSTKIEGEELKDEPIKIKTKRKFWKTPKGEWLTFKEFMERWKKGIEGLTPLQTTKTQLHSTKLVILGIILGMIFSVLDFKRLFWLFIILFGSLGITLSQMVVLWQKKKAHEEIEGRFKE